MSWNGKIIGLILGTLLGGPIGLIVGLMLGHFFDIGLFDHLLQKFGIHRNARQSQSGVQRVFFNSTFMIMGFLAKSDGRVSEKEIKLAEDIMKRMSLNEDMRQQAIHLFNVGKQPNFNATDTLNELKRACWHHPNLLRTFLDIQMQMAHIEGAISPAKQRALQFIVRQFGMGGFNFEQFRQQHRAQENYQRYYQQRTQQRDPKQHLIDAYHLLGVAESANNADVKKAYRRQMSKHHPDRLIAQGVPPEMIKMATQKTQQIKSAYDTIKQARGIT